MALALDTRLHEAVPLHVGPRQRAGLRALGIDTVGSLLHHFPRRYEDRRRFHRFPAEALPEPVCLLGAVCEVKLRRFGRRTAVVEAVVEETGNRGPLAARLTLRWFNMPWLARQLAAGQDLIFFGRPKVTGKRIVVDQPEFEISEPEEGDEAQVHLGRITPIYPLAAGISQRLLRLLLYRALRLVDPGDVPPLLPRGDDPSANGLSRWRALQDIHFPENDWDREAARRLLALEECFALQLNVAARRRNVLKMRRAPRCGPGALFEAYLRSLPYRPTPAQERAIAEIRHDLGASRPMNRLLQGDVGAGKTLVAIAALLLAVESGARTALMAPTQVLADQHFNHLQGGLEPLGLRVSLRTGVRQVEGFLPLLAGSNDEPQITIGTHALLYDGAGLNHLGLAVIDEQHKFGVLQRARLTERGERPDLLVMTATPIPRTLSMTVYGDLDVSVLDELPPGRGSLRTHLRSMEHEHQAAQFVREQAGKGRQAFVLCPLVEESDKIQMSDVLSTRRRWEALLGPGLSCGLLHGRLNGEEKERVMRAFRAGEIQVLVATTVIEVGVDVPNATLMIVLHAERFGLAQLHQLRGRVGRGPHPSHCILLCDSQNPEAIERLRVLEETRDGFRIAEEDLRQRGPGDLLGVAQSGLPGLRLADPVADAGLLCEARELADALLETDPALEQARHAPLRELLLQGERNLAGTG